MASGESQDFEINYTNSLGHGSFGVVYTATNKAGETRAVKQINVQEQLSAGIEEAKKCLLLPCEHVNIIDIYDVIMNESKTSILVYMEYCEFGNLNKFMKRRALDLKCNVEIMQQIANGIAYLHNNNIIHRDMKPDNVLIQNKDDGTPIVKLSDFGLSKFLGEDDPSTMGSSVGTPNYRAPEFWMRDHNGKLHYKRRVDIFAAGLTYLAMLQASLKDEVRQKGLSPYIEVTDSLEQSEQHQPIGYIMYTRTKNGQPIPNILEAGGGDAIQVVRDVISRMIHYRDEDRPEAADVSDNLQRILEKL